jgi:hypothetical protein
MDEDGIENAPETEQEDELDLGEFPLVERQYATSLHSNS